MKSVDELLVTLDDDRKAIENCFNEVMMSDNSEFQQVSSRILNSVLFEIDRFKLDRKDLDYTCLHVRNIFESYLILLHILKSEDGANAWLGQMHRDVTDINDGFSALLYKFGQDPSGLEVSQRIADESLANTGYASERPFNIRRLAEQYGELEEYLSIYKFCSKFIHPSAVRVNAYEAFTERDDYEQMVFYIGVAFTGKFAQLANRVVSESC